MNIGTEISATAVIALLANVVTVVMAWQRLRTQTDELRRRHEAAEARIHDLEERSSETDALLAGIGSDIGWIRRIHERRSRRAEEDSD